MPQQFQPIPRFDENPEPGQRPGVRSDDDNRAVRPDLGPDVRPEPPSPGRRPSPAPSPAMERWHRAQVEQTGGLVSIGIGIILGFVGLVRVVFAQAERQYTVGLASQDSTF